MIPSRVLEMIASSEDSAMEASLDRASSARLRSSTRAARTMNGAAENNKNTCSDMTLLSAPISMNGPRPLIVPQIDRKARTTIAVLTPVVPKRKAAQRSNGTTGNAGETFAQDETKVRYPRSTKPTSSAPASRWYASDSRVHHVPLLAQPKIAGNRVRNASASEKKEIRQLVQ